MADDIKIYDPSIDEMRPVAQTDVDGLSRAVSVMSRSRRAVACVEEITREALRGNIPMDRFFAVLDQLEKYRG